MVMTSLSSKSKPELNSMSKTLTLELACKIIDEISSMDLKEIEAEVNKNLSKWNYYKNDT